MPFSARMPPKGKKIRVYRKIWEGANRRGENSDRRSADRRSGKARRAITNPDRRINSVLRLVEERDLNPANGIPKVKPEWLDEVRGFVQTAITREMDSSGRGYLLAKAVLERKSPCGVIGKNFTHRGASNSLIFVFVGYDPIGEKFYSTKLTLEAENTCVVWSEPLG